MLAQGEVCGAPLPEPGSWRRLKVPAAWQTAGSERCSPLAGPFPRAPRRLWRLHRRSLAWDKRKGRYSFQHLMALTQRCGVACQERKRWPAKSRRRQLGSALRWGGAGAASTTRPQIGARSPLLCSWPGPAARAAADAPFFTPGTVRTQRRVTLAVAAAATAARHPSGRRQRGRRPTAMLAASRRWPPRPRWSGSPRCQTSTTSARPRLTRTTPGACPNDLLGTCQLVLAHTCCSLGPPQPGAESGTQLFVVGPAVKGRARPQQCCTAGRGRSILECVS